MKIDNIIMNPPYSGNLHLKILSHLISLYPDAEVVNLSPIRWLQDPLAEYKKNSDWKKFEDIRAKIEDVDSIEKNDAQDLFNMGIFTDIGIYHLTRNGGWKPTKNSIIEKVLANNEIKHFCDVVVDNSKITKYCVPICTMVGGSGRLFNGIIYAYDKPLVDGKRENDTPFTERLIQCSNWNAERKYVAINFGSKEECENFIKTQTTKFMRYVFTKCIVNNNATNAFVKLPFLQDYTHPWADKDLYDFFHLSDDEIAEIEQEIK